MERIEPPRLLRIETERRGSNAVEISIRDSGKGIDARVIDNIFDAFVTTKAKGKGLGLAISRMIIERHDGQLTASSAGLESGTVFHIVLPVNAEQFRERLRSEP
jgi:signal transduction histidine kinase